MSLSGDGLGADSSGSPEPGVHRYGCAMANSQSGGLPAPIRPTATDLPAAVTAALEHSSPGRPSAVRAGDTQFERLEWGNHNDPPVVLVHGVTSNAMTWWRIGPALAAAGFRVIALSLPGHGGTGSWKSRHRFIETAQDLAAFVRAAGLDRPDLRVVGHSWGALVAAHLPAAGLRPQVLVLLDPPALPVAVLGTMLVDPIERHYDDVGDALRAIRSGNPSWTDGDAMAKATGLTQFDEPAVRAILLDNGDWDGGLAALADPRADGVDTWIVRGDPAFGGMLPDASLPGFAQRIGADHILTIDGGAHSPQRMHPEATVVALLRALGR
jgi:pimeloyl-ACP methyl ester carboxylesterase